MVVFSPERTQESGVSLPTKLLRIRIIQAQINLELLYEDLGKNGLMWNVECGMRNVGYVFDAGEFS